MKIKAIRLFTQQYKQNIVSIDEIDRNENTVTYKIVGDKGTISNLKLLLTNSI